MTSEMGSDSSAPRSLPCLFLSLIGHDIRLGAIRERVPRRRSRRRRVRQCLCIGPLGLRLVVRLLEVWRCRRVVWTGVGRNHPWLLGVGRWGAVVARLHLECLVLLEGGVSLADGRWIE
jgi:hypothetical protein